MKEVLFGFGVEKNGEIFIVGVDVSIGNFKSALELIGGGDFVDNNIFFKTIVENLILSGNIFFFISKSNFLTFNSSISSCNPCSV